MAGAHPFSNTVFLMQHRDSPLKNVFLPSSRILPLKSSDMKNPTPLMKIQKKPQSFALID